MALTDISNDIQDITGVTTADTDFIESAQRFTASSVPKELLWFASAISSAITDANGYDIQSADSVLSVEREGYPAPQVPFAMSKWIDDSTSLHKATAKHPKYYVAQGKVFIKPDPSAGGSNDGYVYYVDYSQIDDDCDLRNAVIFHACSKEFSQLATDGLPSWTSPSLPVAPSSPDFGSDLSISSSAPIVPAITAPTVDTSGWTSPSYTKPVFSAPSLGTVGSLTLPPKPVAPSSPSFTYTDASVTSIVKPIIGISDMASMTESAPSYIKPVISLTATPTITDLDIDSIIPVPPTLDESTVSFSTNAPTYLPPTLESRTTFISRSSGLSETDPGIFSLSAVPPTTPINPSFTTPGISTVSVSNLGVSPTYSSPTLTSRVSWFTFYRNTSSANPFADNDPGSFSIAIVPPTAPSDPSYTTPAINSVLVSNLGTAPTYTAPTVTGETQEITGAIVAGAIGSADDYLNFQHWYDVLADMIETEEDTELAGAQIAKIQSFLTAYQSAMQNQLNTFNDGNVEYQAKLQEAIRQSDINAQEAQQEANLKLQKENQEYSAKLQKYSADLNKYQNDVSKEVQQYTQKLARYQLEVNTSYQSWQKTESDSLQQYQLDMQDSINSFNQGNAEYQGKLQESIRKADIDAQEAQQESNLLLQQENQEYSAKLQKYSSDLNKYQADVGKEVQQYQQKLSQYQLELSTSVQAWQQEENEKVARYQAEVQNNLNLFNKENIEYQAQLQISIQNAQLDSQEDGEKMSKYSGELQSYQNDVNKQVQEYTINEIQKEIAIWNTNIQSDLQSYASDMQNELNSFNKDNIVYQQDIQRKVQNLEKDIQEAIQNAQNDISVNSANLNKSVQIALQNAVQDFQQDVQEYSAKLQKYNSEITAYQAEVSATVEKWQQEEWVQNFQKYQNDYTQLAQTYQSDIQNELNEFSKENAIYQAQIQQSIQDSQLESTEEGQKLQKYSAELGVYQRNIEKEVQDFSNTLNKEVQEYQNKLSLYTADIQKHQSDVAERAQESAAKTQNTQYYERQAERYYKWAQAEITQYIQNNSKVINQTIAAQAAQQQRG